MKPVDFDYERPRSIAEAVTALGANPAAKIMAGGQTLGPMLNLRFAQPDMIVDITRIRDLVRVEETSEAMVLGACITHAAIEDGLVPDVTRGMMQRVASGIAYRAVRTRGTIGGSLAHADPAADWLACLLALDATVIVSGRNGQQRWELERFVHGVMETALLQDQIIDGIEIPRLTASARWGYHKICRKTGEFADAIGAVVIDRDLVRIVAGATGGAAFLLDGPADEVLGDVGQAVASVAELYEQCFPGDLYALKVHMACVRRALDQARSG